MLTNRKKLKNRKRKIKIILISTLFTIFSYGILSYFIWTVIISKTHYISPLPLASPTDSSIKNDKNIENIKERLKKEGIEFSSVSPSDFSYIIHLKDNKEAILSSQKDLSTQISSLQFIILRLTMEGKEFSRLDLRYDKPIIVFN